jgi:hypothetical protein
MRVAGTALIATSVMLLPAASALAAIYRWYDDAGNVHYSDTPPKVSNYEQLPDFVIAPKPSPTPTTDPGFWRRMPKDPAEVAAKEALEKERFTRCVRAQHRLVQLERDKRAYPPVTQGAERHDDRKTNRADTAYNPPTTDFDGINPYDYSYRGHALERPTIDLPPLWRYQNGEWVLINQEGVGSVELSYLRELDRNCDPGAEEERRQRIGVDALIHQNNCERLRPLYEDLKMPDRRTSPSELRGLERVLAEECEAQ